MPTLTIRSVPEELHEQLKGRAERNRRSLNAETVLLLEQAVETLPDEAELRERLRVLGEQTPVRYPSSGGTGSSRYGTETTFEAADQEVTTHGPGPERDAVLRLLHDRRHRLRALGVRRIGLFGSVLRGESRGDSDVDVLVEFDPARKSFDSFLHLASYLEDLLQREVELITTEGLSPYIGPRILQEAEFVTVSD